VNHHLANMNVARFRYEPDDPRLADFVNNLEHINGLGERSDGFVWRLKDDTGNAMAIRAYEDPRVIVNVSVWTSLEALQVFAYRSEHVQFFRRKLEWFEPHPKPSLALWWIPAGEIPTGAEARARLEHLAANGPSPHAFTFKERFAPPQ
jgi:Domain of unknown function (DUF3291)